MLESNCRAGSFEQLGLSHHYRAQTTESASATTQALVRAINGNTKLTHLSLVKSRLLLNAANFDEIFNAVGEHKSLRIVALDRYARFLGDDEDHYYSALERLLSRNRNLVVLDDEGDRISMKTCIRELYALNNFYNGSKKLVQESEAMRCLLFATVLTERISASFQQAGLLLADHTDVLYEFVAGMNLDATAELGMNDSVSSASEQQHH